MNENMTLKEALYYVFGLIEGYYDVTRNTDLALVTKEYSPFLSNGPAAYERWTKAVRQVTPNETLSEREALKVMLDMLKQANKEGWVHLDDVIRFITQESINKDVFKS